MTDDFINISDYPDYDEVEFLETDAAAIYKRIITELEIGVSEPLYPGDERRIYAEALVALFVSAYSLMNDAARQKMLRYARGNVLDALGERTDTPRLQGSPAKTIMRFKVSAARMQNIIIPQGARVTPDGSTYFATDEAGVLQADSIFVDIPASSMGDGEIYNGLPPGTISTLVDMIPYISGVTNLEETYGGDDGEPYNEEGDQSYRERIRISVAKLSTAGPERSYEFHALSADPSIASVSVISPEPGHILLVPLLDNGGIPSQEVLDKVYEACNARTVRPLADFVTVAAPETANFDIEFKYYVTAGDESKAIQTIEGSGGSIERYIRWQTTVMGRDINPDQLRRFVLRPDWDATGAGALRLDVVKPEFQVLNALTVAQFSGNLTVSHEVVTE